MRTAFLPALALGLLLAAPGHAATATEAAAREVVVRRAVEVVIQPGYDALAKAAADLGETTAALCAAPSPATLDAARAQFGDLVGAFAAVEFIRFGPIATDNRIERFLFWPDRRGIALRQVQELLAREDPAAIDPDGLHAKSVAVQGLTALEVLFYGTGAEDLAKADGRIYRCSYARAVTANLHAMADNIAAEWRAPEGIAHRLTAPQPSDPAYRTTDDALDEILGTVIHGLEAIRDLRISAGLGASAKDARPALFVFHRSGNDGRALEADIAGLDRLLTSSGFLQLLPDSLRFVEASVTAKFQSAEAALRDLGSNPAEAAATEAGHTALAGVLPALRSIGETLGADAAPALNLSTGFSSLDGD
ncbi:MAG: imelysin family protein [Methylobacterium sp.]